MRTVSPAAALLAAVLISTLLAVAIPLVGSSPDGTTKNSATPVKAGAPGAGLVRVAAAQAKRRSIDWRLTKSSDVLAAVDRNIDELETIVHKAGKHKCDALALPEDTLGLLDWLGVNSTVAKSVLPVAVKRMLDRLGRAAASHRMYLVVCSDCIEADEAVYNTAFFLGRDGHEIGRYHKVCPTWGESASRQRGKSLPVFETADLGTVGMLICYDLVMPETARCLALEGADMIFFPTMGTAAVGDDDIAGSRPCACGRRKTTSGSSWHTVAAEP